MSVSHSPLRHLFRHAASLVAIALFIATTTTTTARAQPTLCGSTVSAPTGVYVTCPAGDVPSLAQRGLTISVTVCHDIWGPLEGIPASDIWLVGCDPLAGALFHDGAPIASGPTDVNGFTTLTGVVAGSGCHAGVYVVVQNQQLGGSGPCSHPRINIRVVSVDQIGVSGGPPDGAVTLSDFSLFGAGYQSPPKPYDSCRDFVSPFGSVTLADFSAFGNHFGDEH